MASVIRTEEDLQDIFRQMVHMVLDIPPEDKKTVRFPYGSTVGLGSAPSFTRQQNLVFIYVIPQDGAINKQKNLSARNDGAEGKLTTVDEHLDLYQIRFVCYGPKSFQWAKVIRNGISKPEVKWFTDSHNIFLVTAIPAPIPVPETYSGEWWHRYDVSMSYNVLERIETEEAVGIIEDVAIVMPDSQPQGKKKKEGK